MGRRNHRHSAPQARRRTAEERALKVKTVTPARTTPIEKLILPIGRCGRKMMFRVNDAPKALQQAQQLRRAKGQEANMEKRWYLCDRCSHAHLTSRENWVPKGETA